MTPPTPSSGQPSPGSPDPDDGPLGHAIHTALHHDTDPPRGDPQGDAGGDVRDSLGPEDQAVVDELVPWLRGLAHRPAAAPTPDDTDTDTDTEPHRPGPTSTPPDEPDPAAMPPPGDDPLALTLGLVLDPARRVSASRLRHARRVAGTKPSHIARHLTARGWSVATQDVLDWESRDTALIPAITTDLAHLLGTTAGELVETTEHTEPDWHDLFDDPDVRAALADLAEATQTTVPEVTARLDRTLVGADHRNRSQITRRALLGVITALRRHPHLLPP